MLEQYTVPGENCGCELFCVNTGTQHYLQALHINITLHVPRSYNKFQGRVCGAELAEIGNKQKPAGVEAFYALFGANDMRSS